MVIVGYALLFILRHYNFMAVPQPDYFSFRDVARSFARLSWPFYFKRAPLYPALIAVGALVAPGRDPFLTAAAAGNVVAAGAVLALTYFWARRSASRWAPLVVALVATFSQFPLLAAIPLCETVLLLLILAAALSAGRGSGWTYLWAGAAAATRYEALALIPLVALADIAYWRRRRLIAYAAAAAVPVAAWLLAGYVKTGSLNPYVDEIQALYLSGWAFPRELLSSFFEVGKPARWPLAGAFAAVTLLGLARLAARGHAGERVYVAFAVIYTTVHIIFPFSFRRFVLPLWPLLALAFVVGGRALFSAVGRLRGRWLWPAVTALFAGAAAAGVAWRLSVNIYMPWQTTFFVGVLPLVGLIICVLWGAAGGPSGARRAAAVAAAALVVTLIFDSNFSRFVAERRALRTDRAALKSAATWLRRAADPNDIIVASDARLFAYYFGPAGPKARKPASFHAKNFTRFTAKARRAGVAYVCYDSISAADPEGYFTARSGAALLLPLAGGRDRPPYYFLARVQAPGEYVLIYRLSAEPLPPSADGGW